MKSGVACLKVSMLIPEAERLTSDEAASRFVSSTTDRADSIGSSTPLLVDAFGETPQETRDLRTATRHSSPCRRTCASESPIVEVSIVPGTLMPPAAVNDIGLFCPWPFGVGLRAGLGGSVPLTE